MTKDLLYSHVRSLILGVGISALAMGCSGDGGEEAAPTETSGGEASITDADAAPAASGAGLSGKVSFSGEVPEASVISAEGDAKCAAMHKDKPLVDERVVVSADGGLANVFVYVTNPPAGSAAPEAPAVLDQIGCAYTPHVLGLQVGQTMEIRNSDDTTHNVRGIARINKAMNYGQPAGSKARNKVFDEEELAIRMKCDIHPWMTAYVFAMDTPYFGVSDATGAFSISGLPAGEYDVTAWHEEFGEQTGKATVAEDGSGTVDFAFSS